MFALRDPIVPGSQPLAVALVKLWLTVGGLFIWEFISTLEYEWNVIRGHHPYRWTIWVYSFARLGTLMVVLLNMVILNVTSPINCQVAVTWIWSFALLGIGSSSLLIVLRIFAIWNRNKIIVAIAAGIWVIYCVIIIINTARIRAVWVPIASACAITNFEASKPSVISMLVTDVTLLLVMLSGLLRLRRGDGASSKLGRFLWKQGVIWFAVATVAVIPQAVFPILDLNAVLDMMFSLPSVITLTIAATRMYRSLTQFTFPPDTIEDSENPQRSSRLVSSATHPSVVQVPSNRLDITVHTACEEYPMSQMDRRASHISSDAQLAGKPHKINFGDNVEGHDSEEEKTSASVEAAV